MDRFTPEMEEIWAIAMQEGSETLALMEETLLKLETDLTNPDEIARLFRSLHTFKGTMRMMDFSNIEKFTHRAEDLISLVRDEGVLLDPESIDLLFKVLDRLQYFLNRINQTRSDVEESEVTELSGRLKEMVDLKKGSQTGAEKSGVSFEEAPQEENPQEEPGEEGLPEIAPPELKEGVIFTPVDLSNDPFYLNLFLNMAQGELVIIGDSCEALCATVPEPEFSTHLNALRNSIESLQIAVDRMGLDKIKEILAQFSSAGATVQPPALPESLVHEFTGLRRALISEVEILRHKLNPTEPVELESEKTVQDASIPVSLEQKIDLPDRSGQYAAEITRPEAALTGDNDKISGNSLSELTEMIGGLTADQATLRRAVARLDETDFIKSILTAAREFIGLGKNEEELEEFRRQLCVQWEPVRENIQTISHIEVKLNANLIRLQEKIRSLGTLPAGEVFNSVRNKLQSLLLRSGKQVKINLEGEDCELDGQTLELIAAPLEQLAGFCIHESLETPDQRKSAGKPVCGKINISLNRTDNHIHLAIHDDGQGFNLDRIKERALELGWVEKSNVDINDQIQAWLFSPEFGRINCGGDENGIDLAGMENKIRFHGGKLTLQNHPGKGCRFAIDVPVNMSVVDGMVVRIKDLLYVIPINLIKRIIQPGEKQCMNASADGAGRLLRLEEDVIPIWDLHEQDGVQNDENPAAPSLLVVVEKEPHPVALAVDELINRQPVVVQPLSGYLANARWAAGCALLGEGEIGTVLKI